MPTESFDRKDWEEYYRIYKRLLVYAGYKIDALTWMSHPGEIPPKLMSPEDIVSDALTKTLIGERIWNKNKIDLKRHMIGVISSIISHSVNNNENLLTVRINKNDGIDNFIHHDKCPEQKIISKNTLENILIYLKSDFENDQKCLDALKFMIYECDSSPSSLCVGLKITEARGEKDKTEN